MYKKNDACCYSEVERERETERGGSEFQSLKSTDMLRQ